MKLKDIPIENRPRERLEHLGAPALSDAELLAIILKIGNRKENVVDMSNRILSKHGFEKLSFCSLKELQGNYGVGQAKASQILALFELHKRYEVSKRKRKPIKSAKDVFKYISPNLSSLDKEHLVVLHLDSKNKIIKDEVISIGTLNSSLVHPREVFKEAIKSSANSIILVHNHPSGDVEPSEEDILTTKKLKESGEVVGIKLLDHIIIGNGKWKNI